MKNTHKCTNCGIATDNKVLINTRTHGKDYVPLCQECSLKLLKIMSINTGTLANDCLGILKELNK